MCLSLSLGSYGCSQTGLTANDCVICEKGKERKQMQMVQWEGGESVNADDCGGRRSGE